MIRRKILCSTAVFLASPSFALISQNSAVHEYERRTGGHIGLYAENLKTGKVISWRANERFVMCSTFKASLAACILLRVDQGMDSLEQLLSFGPADMKDWWAPIAEANISKGVLSIREMCKGAVALSDNTCASILLSRIGGPKALTAFWRTIGDRETRLDDPEPYLNRTPIGGARNTTTPQSMAKILHRLVLGNTLSEVSRATLKEWLVACATGDNRLRGGLPKNWTVANKTGNNGSDAAGDIAVIWPQADEPIILCAYTRGGHPKDEHLEEVFKAVGNSVAQQLHPFG